MTIQEIIEVTKVIAAIIVIVAAITGMVFGGIYLAAKCADKGRLVLAYAIPVVTLFLALFTTDIVKMMFFKDGISVIEEEEPTISTGFSVSVSFGSSYSESQNLSNLNVGVGEIYSGENDESIGISYGVPIE